MFQMSCAAAPNGKDLNYKVMLQSWATKNDTKLCGSRAVFRNQKGSKHVWCSKDHDPDQYQNKFVTHIMNAWIYNSVLIQLVYSTWVSEF